MWDHTVSPGSAGVGVLLQITDLRRAWLRLERDQMMTLVLGFDRRWDARQFRVLALRGPSVDQPALSTRDEGCASLMKWSKLAVSL